MRLTRRLAYLTAVAAIAALGFGCDLFGDTEEDLCPIPDHNVVRVPTEVEPESCVDVFRFVEVKEAFARPDLTYIEIAGRLFIDFDTPYYLRPNGEAYCMTPIRGQSPFNVRVEYASCTDQVLIDVVSEPEPDAVPICTFRVGILAECD
jgi:hypothetical protein